MEQTVTDKLKGRMLILTDQLGAVAREIKHAIVRPDGKNELEQSFADLVAQMWVLFGDLNEAGLLTISMDDLLAKGVNRKERLKLEAQARGWSWI